MRKCIKSKTTLQIVTKKRKNAEEFNIGGRWDSLEMAVLNAANFHSKAFIKYARIFKIEEIVTEETK